MTSTTQTTSLTSNTPTDSPSNSGQPPAIHINNLYILTFVALILVFVVTCCTVLLRRRDRRRLFDEALTDGLLRGPRLPGPIPVLHDIWLSWDRPGWKNIMPLNADAVEASIMPTTRPHTDTGPTPHDTYDPYQLQQDTDISADSKTASTVLSATGTNQVKIDVLQVAVLIAMPDPSKGQQGRRNRGRLKRAPSTGSGLVRSNASAYGGVVGDNDHDDSYDHDELPILMIGVTRVSPSESMESGMDV
ncbi:hypothetical protein CVT24_008037 [Panaeolus cyanescens]|uniref:Uncharacterized protein n=1 Tax=Panaeolus cyanescens TaxID=181874 RepID=A0A409YQZ4_9AGAR|nr:hypothetical protein CVT24_008037 [Panaeolus cyanescens]